MKDILVDLPPLGFIGNPQATPTLCTTDLLVDELGGDGSFHCPARPPNSSLLSSSSQARR